MRIPALLLLSACAPSGSQFGLSRVDEPANVLVFNNATEPEFLDPTQVTGHPDGRIASELFDGLTEYDPKDLSPRPNHALSWDMHADGKGYTFHLRDDAVWTDGERVTTADYLWSWERVLNPIYLARYAQQLYPLANAELYNNGQAFVVQGTGAALTAGTHVEALSNNLGRLTQAVEAPGLSLPEGATVLVTTRTEATATVSARAACPDLSDLAALAACSGAPVTVEVPVLSLEPTWPIANLRLVTAPATLQGDDGSTRGALPEGDEVYLIRTEGDRALVYHMNAELTGWVPAAGLVDPRADLVTYTVRPLPDLHWSGEVQAEASGDEAAAPQAATAGAHPDVVLPLGALRVDPAVLGVRAEDAHTLTVRLQGVAPYFLQLTSHTTLRPGHRRSWETHGPRWTRPENIVTNGPFLLTEHIVRDRFELTKNPDWWGADTLAFDKVIAYSIDNLHTSANLYRAGYTDFVVANDIPAEFIPMLKSKSDFHVSPALSVYVYRLNTTEPPLDDARVRRALAMAIDKRDVVQVLKAGQVPASHIVPPGLPGYGDGVDGPGFDPEAARALLAEAGYPDGVGFPEISILYNTLESHKLVGAIIQEHWKQHLGITVQLENREWKTYLKAVNGLDYHIARGGWIGDFLDPMTFLELWVTGGGNNNTGWASGHYDDLIRQASQEPDVEARANLLRAAEAHLNEQMPFIPLYWYVWTDLQQPDVRGNHPNLLDQHPIRWMSIDR